MSYRNNCMQPAYAFYCNGIGTVCLINSITITNWVKRGFMDMSKCILPECVLFPYKDASVLVSSVCLSRQ